MPDVPLRRRSVTRERLIAAAVELFVETGALRLSIDEVCSRAGYTRGAFYSNFSSVEDLLFAHYEAKTTELLERLAVAPAAPACGLSLASAVDALLEIVPEDASWYSLRAAFATLARGDERLAATLREHALVLQQQLAPRVEALIESAGRRLVIERDAATRAIIAAHVGSVLQAQLVDDHEALRATTLLAVLTGVSEAQSLSTP